MTVSFYHVFSMAYEVTPPPEVLSGAFSESEIKDFSEAVDDGGFAEDYGYSSDSDLEEDWDFENPAPLEDQSKPRGREALYGQYKEHVQMGMVIRVQDVAFITYVYPLSNFLLSQWVEASKLSYFIYTPIRSRSRRLDLRKTASQGALRLFGNEGKIPRPSPKSVYRLADKVPNPRSVFHCNR